MKATRSDFRFSTEKLYYSWRGATAGHLNRRARTSERSLRPTPHAVWTLLGVTTVFILSALSVPNVRADDSVLWYKTPAHSWEKETLPIGNGRLGGMVFGGIAREHIQFNEESLWIGDEKDTGSYQTFGDLYIELGSPVAEVGVSNPSDHHSSRGQEVAKTVDGNDRTKWCVEHKGRPVVWQITYPELPETPLQSYTFTSAGDVPTRDPRHWRLLGSKDGRTWTELDKRDLDGPFPRRNMSKTFEFANQERFRSYRFVFEHANKTHFQVAEIALGHVTSAYRKTSAPVPLEPYRRSLDIGSAVHTIRYTCDGTDYQRTYFCSYPAQVMVLRLTAGSRAAHTGTIRLTDAHDATTTARGNRITSAGSLAGYSYSRGSARGGKAKYSISLDYEAQVLVLNEGGTLEVVDDAIRFKDCDALTIFLAAGTNYCNRRDKQWKGAHPHERVAAQLTAAASKSYEALLTRHVEDYQHLFRRCAIDLGRTPDSVRAIPTNQRLAAYKQGAADPDLEELVFQFARYLMISSSRPGTLPANLQGLWNQSNRPPWRSDYHTDVNVQMNYWFVDAANLSECFGPLAEWFYSIRGVRRDETRKTFHTRGWITHAENGIFGGSTWKWSKGDAAWVAQNLWDHYAFTQDKAYLRERAYPIFKELCEFWIDHLKTLPDGRLVSPDGVSPEHGPQEDGVSFDQQLVWDLFTNTIEASRTLDEDQPLREKLTAMRNRLLGPKIGRWGQLQEWMVDRDNPKDKQRHLSHMIAIHPGRQISPVTTSELAGAARISMNARGDSSTGWSRAWKISIWARLHDGNRAYSILSGMLRTMILDNLFNTHPPFQIDGNFGYAAGVCEMLLQSHMGEIHFLPALPDAWPMGSVHGMRARGGLEVDMQWQKGHATSAQLKAHIAGTFMLRAPKGQQIDGPRKVTLKAGEMRQVAFK